MPLQITYFFMHTKTQLESMTMDQLLTLAQKIGAEKSNDKTTLIYNIIDAESMVGPVNKETTSTRGEKEAASAEAEPAPKKRGRKPKAEKEQEQETTTSKTSKAKTAKEPEATTPAKTAEPVEPAPKKRGRKPTAEKEQEKEQEATATQPSKEETATKFRIIRDIRPVAQILAEMQSNTAAPASNNSGRPQRPTYNFGDKIIAEGVLELDQSHGRGFLRSSDYN